MKKWIVALAVVIAVILFVFWQRSGTKTAYVNGLPEFTTLPNREYIFERDCYVFKFKDRNSAYPLVGANASDQGARVAELPADVRSENVGKAFPNVRILDVVKSGSRFKIISVRRDTKAGRSTYTFEILFLDEAERRYPRLDAYYILDHTPESHGAPPRIIEGYAVERVKK